MTYDDVKKKYYNLVSRFPAASSNLHQCSYDSTNNQYVLNNNYTSCIAFEEIRTIINPSKNLHACDSLFLSDKMHVLLFIEFKNRPIREGDITLVDIVSSQAVDSLFTHHYVCASVNNAESVPLHFAATLSSEKNNPVHATFLRMLYISEEFFGGKNADAFCEKVQSIIGSKMLTKPGIGVVKCRFSFVGVVFSSSFNAFFLPYL